MLLEVPDSHETVRVTSNQLTSWSLSPLKASYPFVALECDKGFGKSLAAIRTQVKDVNSAVCAASNQKTFTLVESDSLDLTLRIDCKRDYVLQWRSCFHVEVKTALGVTDSQAIPLLKGDQLLQSPC